MEQITEMLKDLTHLHSNFQIDHFIVEKAGVSAWGMYQQALRELDSRLAGIRSATLDDLEIDIDIDEAEGSLATLELGSYDYRRTEVELIRLKLRKAAAEKMMREQLREFNRFAAIGLAMKRKFGTLKPYEIERLEQAHWIAKIRNLVTADMNSHHALSKSTQETLAVLPADVKTKISQAPGEKLEMQFGKLSNYEIDAAPILSLNQMKELANGDGV
jgi:hypothetical protein